MNVEIDPAGTDPEARRSYVAQVHGILYLLNKEINRAIALQVDFNARWSEDFSQTTFGRGGINSLVVLQERLMALSSEHLQNINDAKDEKFNQFDPALDAGE